MKLGNSPSVVPRCTFSLIRRGNDKQSDKFMTSLLEVMQREIVKSDLNSTLSLYLQRIRPDGQKVAPFFLPSYIARKPSLSTCRSYRLILTILTSFIFGRCVRSRKKGKRRAKKGQPKHKTYRIPEQGQFSPVDHRSNVFLFLHESNSNSQSQG